MTEVEILKEIKKRILKENIAPYYNIIALDIIKEIEKNVCIKIVESMFKYLPFSYNKWVNIKQQKYNGVFFTKFENKNKEIDFIDRQIKLLTKTINNENKKRR